MRISDWSSDVCSSDLAYFESARQRRSGYGMPAGHGALAPLRAPLWMPRSRRGRTARKYRPMRESDREKADKAPLNPALKSTTETAHDTDHTPPAPIDTASATVGECDGCTTTRSSCSK